MAVVKLGTTKSANHLISYCEKRSEERESVNCDLGRVKDQFKLERSLWGKEGGIQAHHVIMSFPPYTDNMTTREVAEAGKRLAEELAPGHSSAIYVHADKEHLHAHIVINSVNLDTGKKLHLTPADYFKTQEISDRICQEKGWHTIKEPRNNERYTLAEREIIAKGQTSWKDELRSWIREGQNHTQNLEELKTFLKGYGVEMKIQEKNISYLHPDAQKYVRGKTLGNDFTKEGLNNVYELGRTSETARTARHIERTNERASQPTIRTLEADKYTNRAIQETGKEFGASSERNRRSSQPTREILQHNKREIQTATARLTDSTIPTKSENREPTQQLDSTNVQQERQSNYVSTSRIERSNDIAFGSPAFKAVLDAFQEGVKSLENEKIKDQKAKNFRAPNQDRGELERERERGRGR